MTITFTWYDDAQTILHVVGHAGQSWDEYHSAVRQAAELIAPMAHTVDIIYESRVTHVPPGNPMNHLKSAYETLAASRNMGVVVIIPPSNQAMKMVGIAEVVMRVFNLNLANHAGFARSVEEAYARIQARRDHTEFAA